MGLRVRPPGPSPPGRRRRRGIKMLEHGQAREDGPIGGGREPRETLVADNWVMPPTTLMCTPVGPIGTVGLRNGGVLDRTRWD